MSLDHIEIKNIDEYLDYDRWIPIEESCLGFSMEMATTLAQKLDLAFVAEGLDNHQSNVCFANNNALRPEFRSYFSSKDLQYYIYAVQHSSISEKQQGPDFTRIPYPRDASAFWALAILGEKLRKR